MQGVVDELKRKLEDEEARSKKASADAESLALQDQGQVI